MIMDTTQHELTLTHQYETRILEAGSDAPPTSSTELSASGGDLVAVWRVLLSRCPPDLYAAMMQAVNELELQDERNPDK